MLQQYNGHHRSSIYYLLWLFQIGGCFIQSFCTRLVQLGPGVVAVTKRGGCLQLVSCPEGSGHETSLQHPMTTMDRFHCSDNTLSENAAYQLISSRICQRRRYTFPKEFECSKVSLQYMLMLNALSLLTLAWACYEQCT